MSDKLIIKKHTVDGFKSSITFICLVDGDYMGYRAESIRKAGREGTIVESEDRTVLEAAIEKMKTQRRKGENTYTIVPRSEYDEQLALYIAVKGGANGQGT